ncbi:MAG: hypothetical protein A3K04_12790 [Gallionellales bacterium RBG_16_56_9]|nr:MAG: hypothetical protein A3K04_12790 [Gallionellales bacterium RBG_16_56_9]
MAVAIQSPLVLRVGGACAPKIGAFLDWCTKMMHFSRSLPLAAFNFGGMEPAIIPRQVPADSRLDRTISQCAAVGARLQPPRSEQIPTHD